MATSVFAQDVVEKVANSACDCLSTKNLEGLNDKQKEMQLGVCILNGFSQHKSEIEKGNGGKSILEGGMEEIGEEVGIQMALICPEVFLHFADVFMTDEASYEAAGIMMDLGKITSIEKKLFNIVNLELADGSMLKFLWLWDFEGSEILMKNQFKNKWINIFYSNLEFFDPEKKKYIPYRVIEKVEFGE